jgi:hypothetical protein
MSSYMNEKLYNEFGSIFDDMISKIKKNDL